MSTVFGTESLFECPIPWLLEMFLIKTGTQRKCEIFLHQGWTKYEELLHTYFNIAKKKTLSMESNYLY